MTPHKKAPPAAGKPGGQSPAKRPRQGQVEPSTERQRPGPKPRGGEVASELVRILLTPSELAELDARAGGAGRRGRYVRTRLGLGACPADSDPLSYEVTQSLDVGRLARAAERWGVDAVILELQTALTLLETVGRGVERR